MTVKDRFIKVFNGETDADRLPMIEWATWWDLTLKRWDKEGLPMDTEHDARFAALGLDLHQQVWFPHRSRNLPGDMRIADKEDYAAMKPYLYPLEECEPSFELMARYKARHAAGKLAEWFTLEGGFWFPRTLFGITAHLYSFYDEPDLYHRILEDLAEYELKLLERLYQIDTPEFMTFAEDMSYNNGPMISEKMFDEFLLPFYNRVVPFIKAHGTKIIVDSDGDITNMVPWLIRAGFDGALPLEYQAGVDISKIRRLYPDFIMIGGFNKRVMKDGEAAMRREFERILPVMRSGRYIPSVDHQTPPDVSLEQYMVYIELLKEYCALPQK